MFYNCKSQIIVSLKLQQSLNRAFFACSSWIHVPILAWKYVASFIFAIK